MILHLYFARRFAMLVLLLMGVLFSLMILIDLIEQTRRFSSFDVSFGQRLGLTLLNAPARLNEILPLILLLATVVLFVGLARTSELVVTRAAGRSAIRALFAPGLVALAIGGFAVAVLNPIVAATSQRYTTVAETYRSGGASALSLSGDGLWLRQGGAQGQTVIRASRANADGSTLYDVTFLAYSPAGGPVRRLEARSAELTSDGWMLSNAKAWPLTAGLNPEANAARHERLIVPTSLTLDRIRETIGSPSGISIWDLSAFIDQLEQAGFSARRHHVWFQSELARPLFLLSMVLIAAAFTMRPQRSGGTGVAVLTAVLLGFGLYFIRSFAQILGENGQIPILFAAWATPVAANLLALGLLLNTEDG